MGIVDIYQFRINVIDLKKKKKKFLLFVFINGVQHSPTICFGGVINGQFSLLNNKKTYNSKIFKIFKKYAENP